MRSARTVALLARPTGLAVLKGALLGNPQIDLRAVYTHSKLPKAEGAGPRPELEAYQAVCRDAGVALHVLDLPEARRLEDHLPAGELDLMVVLSWKFIVPAAALARFQLGGINLHRGQLPEFAGLEPVRRAIEAGARRVAITAHSMTQEVDAGEEVARVWLTIDPPPVGTTSARYAEAVKRRLDPLYAPLARLALTACLA